MPNDPSNFPLGLDFYFYWSAGKVFGHGGNPYDTVALEAAFHSSMPALNLDFILFPYLPLSLPWLAPLGYLSPSVAFIAWAFILVCSMVLIGLLSHRMLPASRGVPWLPYTLLVLAFPPVLRALLLGQAAAFLSGCVIAGLFLMRSGRQMSAGCLISVALWKPQSYIVLLVALVLLNLRVANIRLLIGICLGTVAQLLTVLMMRPTVLVEYLEFIRQSGPVLIGLQNNRIIATVAALGLEPAYVLVPLTAMLGVGIWSSRARFTFEHLVTIVIPVSLLCAPYGWVHESILLIPAIALIGGVLWSRFGRTAFYTAIVAMAPMLLLIPGSRIEACSALFPLLTIIVWVALSRLKGVRV